MGDQAVCSGRGPFEGTILLKLGAWKKRGQQVLAYRILLCLKAWRPCPAFAESDAGMRPLPSPSFSLSLQDLYLLIMKDESLYQDLREDTLRLHQLVETVELK